MPNQPALQATSFASKTPGFMSSNSVPTHYPVSLRFSVWLDADSCPRELRPILLRAAARLHFPQDTASQSSPDCVQTLLEPGDSAIPVVAFHFVAASPQCLTPFQKCALPNMYFHEVAPSPNATDHFIEAHCRGGDIVITRDIVFAQKLCLKNIDIGQNPLCIINDRGTEYTHDNVFARRRQRDVALELRNADLLPPPNTNQSPKRGPTKRSYAAKAQFAACFDRCFTRQLRRSAAQRKTAPETGQQ